MLTLETLQSDEENKDHLFLALVLIHALRCYNLHIQVKGDRYSPDQWHTPTRWGEKLYACWVQSDNESSRDLLDNFEEMPTGLFEDYEIPPFAVPILKTKPEVLFYIMDMLVGVFWFSKRSGLMYRNILEVEYDDCFPVTWDYFKKIVVNRQSGEWKVLDPDGKVSTVIGARGVTELSYQQLQTMSAKDKAIARDRRDNEKIHFSSDIEKMKKKGFPYEDTFDEYVRFLKTNVGTMNIANKFTIKMKDIFDIFIPYPFN
jgi:hypothetical protein